MPDEQLNTKYDASTEDDAGAKDDSAQPDANATAAMPKPAKRVHNPHDRLFRRVFSDPNNARGQLQRMVPAWLLKAIDWQALKLEPGSYVDEKLDEFASDLLFSARFSSSGRPVAIYLLFEHQRTSDPWMPFRFLNYACQAWMDYKKRIKPKDAHLPELVPLLLYQGTKPWPGSKRLSGQFGWPEDGTPQDGRPEGDEGWFIELKFVVHNLGSDDLSAAELNVMTRVTLSLMKRVAAGALTANEAALVARWLGAVREHHGWDAFRVLAEYIFLTQRDGRTFDAIAENVSEPMREEFLSYGEQLEARGWSRGWDKGRAKGRAELVLMQLGLRFGELPLPIRQRVESASANELERWAKQLLTAESLTKVFEQ